MIKKAHLPIRPASLCALAGVAALSLAAAQPLLAAEPADDLRAAVAAAGAPSFAEARPAAFMAAFSSVLVAAQDRDVPAYAAAALRVRPDLLGPILDEAVAALTAPGRVPAADQMAALVSATVAVKPEATREIVRRLIANAPEAKAAIVSAATKAAPQETAAIAQASGASGLQVANLQGSAATDLNRLRMADVLGAGSGAASATSGGVINNATAEGTLNPANVSTTRLRRPAVSTFY